MIKKLILKTIFSKIQGSHQIILQQLDYFTAVKWIDRYESKLGPLVRIAKNPDLLSLTIQHPGGVVIISGYKSNQGIIKSPSVFIDRDLPNPNNYKQF